jgi:hypothetical protein
LLLLAALAGAAAPAWAAVGIAVVLDLPNAVKVGHHGLSGSVTITNINTLVDQANTNLVSSITVTPACGARITAAECPDGAEDPGVIEIDPTAIGRSGTACDGTVFTVTETNPATGQVTFGPPGGYVTLGPVAGPLSASQCVVDFTFSVNDLPGVDHAGKARGMAAETTAYAGALAMSSPGLRPGMGGNHAAVIVH